MAEKDYSQLEKEDLLTIIEKLESRKKYGLIWDEERTKERFEKNAENALPVLKKVQTKDLKLTGEDKVNLFIEGDNYHALSVLNFTHQEKIDVIYIDPPYNTGENDFIYNDNLVDDQDEYRHSKWLSFMSKRLRLAKNLLTDRGVLFISIDNHEFAQLKLLLDTKIFDESNFLGLITWINKTKPVNSGKAKFQLQQNVEYILCYSKERKSDFQGFSLINEGERKYKFNDKGGDYRLVLIEDSDQGSKKRDSMKFEILGIKPGDGKRWKIGNLEAKRLLKEGHLVKIKGQIKRKIYSQDEAGDIARPFWSHLPERVGTAESGKAELSKILGKEHGFDTVKPKELIQELLEHFPKDITVLDFFAGSGTTAQAVIELNRKDEGTRKFVICTNNDNGIADKICYPRVKKNLKSDLRYFKTSFVKNSLSRDDLKIRLSKECTEMLCIREGVFEQVINAKDYLIFKNKERVLAIYHALEIDALAKLKENLDKISGEKTLYCFTLDPLGLSKRDFVGWDNVKLEPIPQKILDIYRQIYEY